MKAIDLADVMAALFHEAVGTGVNTYHVELTAPEGPSTGGGKQAVQHLKLNPTGNGPTLVIGAVNQVESTAEIRTFDYLSQVHAQRFKGARLPLEKSHYLVLQRNIMGFLSDRQIVVTVLDGKAAAPTPVGSQPAHITPERGGPPPAWMYIALGLSVGVFVAGIFFYLMMRTKIH